MPVLNLYNLVYPTSMGSMRYLRMNQTVIGAMQGKMPEDDEDHASINLVRGTSVLTGVSIINSQIGVIEPYSLSFTNKDTMYSQDVKIEGSNVGFIKDNGIRLAEKVLPTFESNTMTLDGSKSIVVDDENILTAEKNRIVLPMNILDNKNCEQNNLAENEFILVQGIDNNHDNHNERATSLPFTLIKNDLTENAALVEEHLTSQESGRETSVNDYIHPSCLKKNTILNMPRTPFKNQYQEPTINPLAEVNSTVRNFTEDDFELLSVNGSDTSMTANLLDSNSSFRIHKIVAYFIVGGIGALTMAVLVLAGMLAFTKRRSRQQVEEAEEYTRDRRPSLMYMPGSMYGGDTWAGAGSMLNAN